RPGALRSHARADFVSRLARGAAAEPRARRRRIPPRDGLLHAARLRAFASLRRRNPLRPRRGGDRSGGARLSGGDRRDRRDRMPDGEPVPRLEDRAAAVHAGLRARLRPLRAQGHGHGARRPRAARRGARRAGQRARADAGVRAVAFRRAGSVGIRAAPEAAALRRFPGRARARPEDEMRDSNYNFAYLDERTKRMIRRAILKAVAIPGFQVPFGSREMPLPYGWGTGGVQVTASVIGPSDVLKVIDQGADDTVNAVNIRAFFQRTTGVATTERTAEATIIQTRHRIPETPLADGQILVYQ